MELWTWLALLLTMILTYVFYHSVLKWDLKMRKMYPYACTVPLIGSYIDLFRHRNDLYGWFKNVAYYFRRSIYINILGQTLILLFEASDVEKILGVSKHLEKSDLYRFLHDWIGNGLLTSKGNKWKKSRKILTPAFHFNILESFVAIFHKNGIILREKLLEYAGKPNFDVYEIIKLYALDNICECAMGVKIGAQTNPNGEYVHAVNTLCETSFERITRPWLWPDFLYRLTKGGIRNNKALQIVHDLTESVIESRKRELESQKAEKNLPEDEMNMRKKQLFIDILLTSNEAGGLTFEEIREEIDTFMFEGHDTITSALSFALYLLSQNPQWQERAYEEQVALFGDDKRVPSLSDLNNMKILEMIIKETLRLFPSVPVIGRIVDEDVVFDEFSYAPKGSCVVILTPVLHQHIYKWENAVEFNPERFNLEETTKRHTHQFIPFSSGPRNCIGMRFAMYEMKSALSTVLRKVELLPSDPPVPPFPVVALVTKSKTGMQIRAQQRNNTK